MRPLLLAYPLDENESLRWMLRGVRGTVSYDSYEKELSHAVRKLAQGELYFPSQVVRQWKQIDIRVRAAAQCLPLTRRELEVAGLLSRRLSNKQIGVILGLTERTVKFHVGNVLRKLSLGSRYELHATSSTGLVLPTGVGQPLLDTIC
jgi:DNA-binding NarL/FixJ family response regulator